MKSISRDQTDSLHFSWSGEHFAARRSAALWWPEWQTLVVADLHLGRSERVAREGGRLLPPYDTIETLARLDAEIEALSPREVICLGDSFDDLSAARNLEGMVIDRIDRIAAGRLLTWIAGNHDPGPTGLPGTSVSEKRVDLAVLRHIADWNETGPEISGHFHPKVAVSARGLMSTARCFIIGEMRIIMPAFGAYTGGLEVQNPAFAPLQKLGTRVITTGRRMVCMPLPSHL